MIEERATYQLGFAALAEQIPEIVGEPLEDEHWSENGDSLQATTNGLMVYRKDTNTPAFTDGGHTWLLGPNGLQDRDNGDLFDWEQPPAPPGFLLGFKALAEMIPDIVGESMEGEHYSGEGNSLQATTGGLLVWRKADNWTAFTNGERTWLLGPNGLQDRLNTERFEWEFDYPMFNPQSYEPRFILAPNPSESYQFLQEPRGFALHGSRSGIDQSLDREFDATVAYALRGAAGCAWNYTVGPGVVAQHLHPKRWGWHARLASRYYVSIEIANPTFSSWVTDEEARDVAWCIRETRTVWPRIPLYLPTHSELEHLGETGRNDGKSDVFAWWSVDRAEDLRGRIMAELRDIA